MYFKIQSDQPRITQKAFEKSRVHLRTKKYCLLPFESLLEYYSTIKKILTLGDFDLKRENKAMKAFLRDDTLYKMMKRNACSKGD